jgi:diaminopimelate decarboxylase
VTAIPLSLLPDTAKVLPDGSLSIGGCSVLDLVAEFGTPLFIYDEAHLRARCREAVAAFGPGRAVYATKAFLCRAMARLAYDEGMLLDVASGGEM